MDDAELDRLARQDLQRAREAATAMHANGDPMGFVRPYQEALDEDTATGGDLRRIGLVSALTLLVSGAMLELDRVVGDDAGREWLQRAALRDERG